MDFYGTASTAITQVYQVTVFIRGVISDVQSFDDDRAEMQLKLDVQLCTLEFFKVSFLSRDDGLMLPGKLDPHVSHTLVGLLVQMRKTLAEYEIMASKYDLADDEYTIEPEKPKIKASMLERAKNKARSLKLKAYDWSLFDKKKLNDILEAYTEWSEGLRNVMQHLSQVTLIKLAANDLQGLKSSGLEPVMKRRNLATVKAPADYHGLTGTITEESNKTGGFQLGKWVGSGGKETQVIVEYHDYENRLKRDDLDQEEIDEYKEPIRNLAWLLQNSTFTGKSADSLDQPKIYALDCIGFVDQPKEERTVFLYKLPPSDEGAGSSFTTLHAFINSIDSTSKRLLRKPCLNDRFSIAYTLALTLSNVHGSSWLHKNIWSRGILLFLETPTGVSGSDLNKHRLSPTTGNRIVSYLGDWGYARSEGQGTDLRPDGEIEPNLYRHPDRQGQPSQQFKRLHDIYALGVVLLEIGLWVTLSQLMEKKIREAENSRRGALKPKHVFQDLVALATRDLPREMGLGYTQAVLACLNEDFRGTDGPSLAVDFQAKVIDVLKAGVKS